MVFKLTAFLLLCIPATLVLGTADDEQSMDPNTHAGESKKIVIVFKSKMYPDFCLGHDSSDVDNAIMMYECNTTTGRISFTQYRYGDDGVFLLKHGLQCHSVGIFKTGCNLRITPDNTCSILRKGNLFWFEAYGDEGWGIVRSAVDISPECSLEGPPSLHAFVGYNGKVKVVNLGSATEEGRDAFLWKIKKFECRNES